MVEPLTAEELEERRRNLAWFRQEAGMNDNTILDTNLLIQEQWLATIDAERQRAERAEAQVEAIRHEGCA